MTTLHSQPNISRQHGISLIEISIVIGILGIAALALPQLSLLTQPISHVEHTQLTRAHNALMGFVLAEQRLPCPAQDSVSGEESCQIGSVGYFPFKALGLPDPQTGNIRYGVMRNASANADMTERRARLNYINFDHQGNHWLSPASPPLSLPDPARDGRGRHMKDFCQALKNIAKQQLDEQYVHVKHPAQTEQADKNVVYALALPGSGRSFEGAQALNTLAFDSPSRAATASYHDKVLINTPETLWEQLACSPTIVSVHHHATMLLNASLHTLALTEVTRQLSLRKRVSKANLDAGIMLVVNSTLALAEATATVKRAIGDVLASAGDANPAKVAADAKALKVAVTAALIAAQIEIISVVALAIEVIPNHKRNNDNHQHVSTQLLPDVILLRAQIVDRFGTSRHDGLFLPAHTFSPEAP